MSRIDIKRRLSILAVDRQRDAGSGLAFLHSDEPLSSSSSANLERQHGARKISEKRSGPDRASTLHSCWPRDERSAAIERRGRADVELPPVAVAPVEVAGHFRDTDHAEYLTVRREDMNPARAGAEQIAFGVDLHAIRHSRLVALKDGPDLASGNAVFPHREPTNVHLRCVVDVENRLFLSETQAVRPFKILDQSDDCAVPRIKSIDT